MKIAILWSRFGPYHLARLEGARSAARRCGADVVGVAVSDADSIYKWDRIEHGGDGVMTVFPGSRYEAVGAADLRKGLAKVLNGVGCNVVAINGWSVAESRVALAWRRADPRRRAVLMSETKRDDSRRHWWKELLKRRIVKRCDAALVGGRTQRSYVNDLGMEKARIFTGYNAVDNAYFKTGAEASWCNAVALRRRHELPKCYFLACTRFLPRKNVDGLLRAYERYCRRSEGPPWGLVILGSGAESERLGRLERRLNLVQKVSWPGFVQYDSLPVYYGLASAFIHPAKSEPWGLVVNEAAASRLPLLVSKTVGARYELVEEEANGYLFDPFNVEDLAESMAAMSRLDDETRRRMGRHSEAIVDRFSPQNFGRQLLRAAETAIARHDT